MTRFESRPDGEYAECPRCVKRGYGEDSWLPMTTEYWITRAHPSGRGGFRLSECKACYRDGQARAKGIVPASRHSHRVAA